MFRVSVLVLTFLAFQTGGCRPAAEVISPDGNLMAACQVTDMALASNTSDDRPWFLSDAAPRTGDEWRTEEVVRQVPRVGEDPETYVGWHSGFAKGQTLKQTEGPSVEMARAFALSNPVNGDACPEVRARAEVADRRFSGASSDTSSFTPGAAFPRVDVMLDQAVVSPDGREALVYLGQQSAPLAGGGYLILYRRGSGDWMEAARLPLWVS